MNRLPTKAHLRQRRFGLRDDLLPVRPLRLAAGRWPPAAAAGHPESVLKNSTGPSLPTNVNSCSKLSISSTGMAYGSARSRTSDPLPFVGPLGDGDDQVAAVVGDRAVVTPLGMLRPPIDQHVGRLRRAEAVVAELVVEVQRLELGPGCRLVEAAVEEALAVLGPGGAGELGPFQLVGQHSARVAISITCQVDQSEPASARA